MRKIYAALLSLIFLLVWNSETKAQVSAYVFSQTSGTYTPITGGTVLGNTASDDQRFLDPAVPLGTTATTTGVGLPIGFNFTYNGIVFDRFGVNNNGWIGLGQSSLTPSVSLATTSAYTPLASTTATTPTLLRNRIAGFGRDLQGQTGSELRFETIGSAPNRKLVVQFTNYKRFGTAGTGDNFNFQIILSETTNTVQVVYGTVVFNTTTTASTVDHVGLGGTVSTDFNNRLTEVPHNWNATIPGSTNADGCQNATSIIAVTAPVSGLTFNWAVPTCFPPTGVNTTALTTSGATINWTAPASAPAGGYEWEVRTSGAPGSGATGLGASGSTAAGVLTANATGLASSVTYRVYVRSVCIASTDYSNWSIATTFTTLCPPVNVPYSQNFNATTPPAIPSCTSIQDVNGGTTWATITPASPTWGFPGNALRYLYNTTLPGNDWFFTQGLNLTGGTTYQVSFKYGATDPLYPEKMKVAFGNAPNAAAMTTTIVDYPNIVANAVAPFAISVTVPFTPVSSGAYHLGFHVYSNADQFQLFLDDILVEVQPTCLPATGLNVSAVTTTTATLNWTASASAPTNGYEWEIRSSGAPGSGATGLAASGVTAAGIITANAGGLTPNTAYSAYVRGNCSGVFSPWTAAVNFSTPCLAITSFPYTETYEAASPTRSCWTTQILSGTFNWTYGAGSGNGGPVTTAHGGTVNARFFGSGYGAEQALFISPELNLSSPGMIANGADLEFWVANPSWLGDINPMRVLYKTSAAGSWTVLPGAVFTNPINAWTKIEIPSLPNISSTYYIAFEGTQLWGWGLAIDDVVIKEGPSCRKPTAVSAIGVTPTSAEVYFTSTGNNFIVEWGAPGFTPGTGATAGVGGTIVTGTASPIVVGGLTANTNYDFYLRRVCVPNVDYSENVRVTGTTLCVATSIPYLQTFESAFVPGMPTCTSVQDLNGNSGSVPNSEGGSWFTFTGTTQTYVSPSNSLRYLYDAANLSRPADDWFFLQGLNLTAGTSYRLKFFYKGSDGPTWTERLEVKYGTSASANGMASGTLLFTNNNIATALASPFDSARVDFTPTASGVYYIGFHATSLADQAFLYIDDISVKLAPLVDVGISNMTLPNINCPVNNVFIQAEVKNYNTTTVNFATTPVTVNARIIRDGTVITNLPGTVLNSGTLAPNATMGIYLGTAYNFVAGSHEIILNTTSPLDPELQNDTLRRLIKVNATPATPVITPAAPQICLGSTVQLSTQFTASPAPVTHPAVTSGALTLAIPDNSPAGVSHTLAVAGIPANATVTGISVTLNATHTWNADMIFNLRAPNGSVLNLVNRKGGSGDNYTNCIISSASTTALPTAATSPVTGTFAADAGTVTVPTGFASTATNFAGLYSIANGNWTLAVNDNAGLDVGTLTSWSITITYQVITPVITWTPITGLFTNAPATTAYTTGTDAYSVYSKPAATGSYTYTATATSAAGCTASSTATVTVNPNPVVTVGSIPDTVCISDQIVPLVGNPVGGSWSGIGVSGNNFIPPSTAVGNYILTYSYVNAFGCPGSATKRIVVEDCPERIILLRDNAITLFPNPTDGGRFNIRINSVLYNKLSMRVYTNEGKIVRTQQFNGLVYGRVVPIDLSALPGGVYIVKFAYEDAGPRTTEKSFKVIIGH